MDLAVRTTASPAAIWTIVVVAVVLLAFWLIMIWYADRHPYVSSAAPTRDSSAMLEDEGIPAGHSGAPPQVPTQRGPLAPTEPTPPAGPGREAPTEPPAQRAPDDTPQPAANAPDRARGR